MLTHTPPPSSLGVGGFERAAPSAADPEKKTTWRSSSNFNKMGIQITNYSYISFILKTNVFLSGPQESHFGDPNYSPMVKNRTFLIRGGAELPPGPPEASWTAYTAADCIPPPGPRSPGGELDCIYCSGLKTPPRDPGGHLARPSPGPRPPGDYF